VCVCVRGFRSLIQFRGPHPLLLAVAVPEAAAVGAWALELQPDRRRHLLHVLQEHHVCINAVLVPSLHWLERAEVHRGAGHADIQLGVVCAPCFFAWVGHSFVPLARQAPGPPDSSRSAAFRDVFGNTVPPWQFARMHPCSCVGSGRFLD
jgi:hypothetical protein